MSGHPLDRLIQNPPPGITPSTQLSEDMEDQLVTLAGITSSVRPITTKKGRPMAFVELEDPQGTVDVTVFPRVYEQTRELWDTDNILLLKGKVQIRDERIGVICEEATEYAPSAAPPPPEVPAVRRRARKPHKIHITLSRSEDPDRDVKTLAQVYHLLEQNPGQDSFFIYVSNGHERVQMEFPNTLTHYTQAVHNQLGRIVGQDAIRVD
jgi:DNA polymerase-3 subunit alpha